MEIQSRVAGVDALGQPLDDWEVVATAWAAIEDRRGRELVESRQAVLNEVTTNVRVRYLPGIQPEMRIVDVCGASAGCSGRVLNITSVRDAFGRRRDLLLEAETMRVVA